ncbi:hypothetical protein pv_121 [Pithovirus sibericum]|uniref:Uncharacterized protein n=1 Tax=Pithovirus sibericum TaxID=1450746 RepID=W5S4M2_9VIRU|nr:hypothetical protein pv_121 [Pithovirus sibericum]AHH01688.1 hypothetical protein pv_121 [Pithovirus sibericum]
MNTGTIVIFVIIVIFLIVAIGVGLFLLLRSNPASTSSLASSDVPIRLPFGNCTSNSECVTGQYCSTEGICTNQGTCLTSGDCPGSQICSDGVCISCRQDGDCSNGEICSRGQCVVPSGCRLNSDCPNGGSCLDGKCVECVSDAGCSDGKKCRSGTCSYECTLNTDCGSGQLCINGVCSECVSGSDCATGVCTNGFCSVCTSDSSCPSGQVCSEGSCVPNQTPPAPVKVAGTFEAVAKVEPEPLFNAEQFSSNFERNHSSKKLSPLQTVSFQETKEEMKRVAADGSVELIGAPNPRNTGVRNATNSRPIRTPSPPESPYPENLPTNQYQEDDFQIEEISFSEVNSPVASQRIQRDISSELNSTPRTGSRTYSASENRSNKAALMEKQNIIQSRNVRRNVPTQTPAPTPSRTPVQTSTRQSNNRPSNVSIELENATRNSQRGAQRVNQQNTAQPKPGPTRTESIVRTQSQPPQSVQTGFVPRTGFFTNGVLAQNAELRQRLQTGLNNPKRTVGWQL